MNFSYNIYFLAPEVFLVTTALCLLVIGVWLTSSKFFGFPIISRSFFLLTLLTLVFSLLLVLEQSTITALLWNSLLSSNFFSVNARILLILLSIGILLISQVHLLNQKINFFEFWILIILTVVSISFIIQSVDLLTIYISIEFQSLLFYILASFNRNSEFSTEAGLKYFILGAFASAFLLCGTVLIYHTTGLTNLIALSKLLSGINLDSPIYLYSLILGIFFILLAFLFKFNVAPFHFWSPDVYDGSPLPTTSVFAFLPKIAIASLIIKLVLITFFDLFNFFGVFLLFCSLSSAIIGFFGAFSQNKWKRFIAYSAIGHGSFILLGLSSSDLQAIDNIFLFLIIYSFSSLLVFLILTNLRYYQFPLGYQIRFLSQISSLAEINPTLALALLVVMFSFAGIPPLAGFFSKLFILLTSLKTTLFGISILLVLLNCFASFYYIRFVKLMYFETSITHLILLPSPFQIAVVISLVMFSIVFLFIELDFFTTLTKLLSLSIVL